PTEQPAAPAPPSRPVDLPAWAGSLFGSTAPSPLRLNHGASTFLPTSSTPRSVALPTWQTGESRFRYLDLRLPGSDRARSQMAFVNETGSTGGLVLTNRRQSTSSRTGVNRRLGSSSAAALMESSSFLTEDSMSWVSSSSASSPCRRTLYAI